MSKFILSSHLLIWWKRKHKFQTYIKKLQSSFKIVCLLLVLHWNMLCACQTQWSVWIPHPIWNWTLRLFKLLTQMLIMILFGIWVVHIQNNLKQFNSTFQIFFIKIESGSTEYVSTFIYVCLYWNTDDCFNLAKHRRYFINWW